MVDPHRMMRKYDPAEGFTQPLVHAWFVGVNINAIRCTQHDACITLVGWCAQPLAYAWRAWVNATATRCKHRRPAGEPAGDPPYVNAAWLEGLVWADVRRFLND